MPKIQPIPKQILTRLEKEGRAFEALAHRTVFTAYDAAATLRRSLDEVGKALIVKAGPLVAVAVMPASRRLDTAKLGKALAKYAGKQLAAVKIVSEKEVLKTTEEKERPVTAFASYYELPLFVDVLLAKKNKVIFPAGSFNNSLEMKVKEFLAHEKAVLASFTMAGPKPQKQRTPVKKKAKKGVAKKKTVKKADKKSAKPAKKTVKPLKKTAKKTLKKSPKRR